MEGFYVAMAINKDSERREKFKINEMDKKLHFTFAERNVVKVNIIQPGGLENSNEM